MNYLEILNDGKFSIFSIIQWQKDFALYVHPLGFFYSEIEVTESHKIRIHYWEHGVASHAQSGFDIHNHIFDVQSWVVLGELTNYEYEVKRSGGAFKLYEVEYKKNLSVMKLIDSNCNVGLKDKQIIIQGKSYKVPRGVFHKTKNEHSGLSVSVMVASNYENSKPKVVSPSFMASQHSFHRCELSYEKRIKLMENLMGKASSG